MPNHHSPTIEASRTFRLVTKGGVLLTHTCSFVGQPNLGDNTTYAGVPVRYVLDVPPAERR